MKKITLLIACVLAGMSGYAQCDPVSVPYSENFESVTIPALPPCTTNQNVGTGNNWTTSVPGSNGFTTKTLTYLYSLNAANTWFYTKALNLTGGTSYRLTYKYGNNGYTESLKVAYGTANNATAMTTVLADQPSITNSDGPLTKTIDFTPATTGVYYIGYNIYSIANQNSLFVDDITLDVSPACIEPTSLVAAATTENSVSFSWTAATAAPASGYQYYVNQSDTAPTDATTPTGSVAAGVVTATAGSLTASTAYNVWVRSNCGTGSYSTWTGPINISTMCDYGDVLSVTPGSVCGQGLVMLNATGSEGSVLKWYNAATGGNQIGQGPVFVYYVLQTTTYYVAAVNGDCEGPRTPVLVTVTPATAITPSATATNICTGGSTTLSVTSTNPDYTYSWFPGNLTGPTQTVAPTATTEYTVMGTDSANNCTIVASITITVGVYPSEVTIAPLNPDVCQSAIQTLTANGGTIGGEATIGTGTALTGDYEQPTAFCNRWSNYWSQSIYTAAELNAAGLTAGNITSIAFDTATMGSASSNNNFTVKIGTTTIGSFENGTYLPTTDFTTVYGPIVHGHTASGWQVITFTTPYVWDGVSNIVVNITHDGANAADNAQTRYSDTTDTMVIWQYNYDGSTTGELSTKRPNVKFTSTLPTTVTWSPVNHLYSNALATVPYVAGTVANTVYFRSPTAGTSTITATATSSIGCATSGTVEVTVLATEPATVAATQAFCGSATVANLTATGTALQWYTVGIGGTPLASATALVNGTTYYVSQTVNGCESGIRMPSTVQVTTTVAPAVAISQVFCTAATVANLSVTGGTAVQWYAAATGGTPIAQDVALVNGSVYYASQTVSTCESTDRTAVTVTLSTTVADDPADVTTCNAYILPALTNGNYYTGANGTGTMLAAGATIDATATLYVYAQSGTTPNCTAQNEFTVTITTVDAPSGAETQTIALGTGETAILSDIEVTATGTVTWYPTEEAALAGTGALPVGTVLVTGTTYYATQTIGECTSTEVFEVTITLTLGTKDFDASALKYYPNPVSNNLTISYSSEITAVNVTNLLGQQVLSVTPNVTNTTVDMSGLSQGTYLVTVSAAGRVKTIKIVKE
ncbi:T9SS type A sorting domain-containing protein [Flavobacterium zepuense]|uniref:T9SS type A sorting domain-containing protein n=1 Tax=Flavobacterium zepuense TaxID=2593302 RepID=A0A552UY17_9FLAO|nr:T9SS type A sorting domain-containing protein [Flavobacterium zepuense]TRW23098.1 T9SS type A sorting domain-containing protein [Flavobacterium zepuense]